MCGETDAQCISIPAGPHTHVWCIRGEGREGAALLAGWGFRKDKGGIWYFLQRTDGATIAPRPAPRREVPLADLETINRVLRATARALGLSAEHRAKLAARGYDPEQCGPEARHAFASLPASIGDRYGVAAHLFARGDAETASELVGVYGYAQDRRREGAPVAFLERVEGTALLEFVRDPAGRYVGFEYAPDVRGVDAKGKPGAKRKAPLRLPKGELYHVARPEHDNQAGEVWHTEAIHKANLTADARHAIALGSLGAGNAATLLAGAKAVDAHKQYRHVLALDPNQWNGPAEQRLAAELAGAGYAVALARWDAAHNGPDDAIAAGAAIVVRPYAPHTAKRHTRPDTRISHTHAWQRREEGLRERRAILADACQQISDRVRAHIDAGERERILAVLVGPGVGKTFAVSALGAPTGTAPAAYALAWVAERQDMVRGKNSAKAFKGYHHTVKCSAANCPAFDVHTALLEQGYATFPLHAEHKCDYWRQALRQGSTTYMLEHLVTPYPAQRDAIAVDECDLARWLPAKQYTVGKLRRAAAALNKTDSTADMLLRALQALLADRPAPRSHQATGLHGKALYDALDAKCGGQLAAWLAAMQHDRRYTDTLPRASLDAGAPDTLEQVRKLPEVVVPHIWQALFSELPKWQRGGEWNSCLRVAPATVGGEWGLYITERRSFKPADRKPLPPRIVLDATADAELLTRLFDAPVDVVREDVPLPPHTRHIAVRTGKRYGKVAMIDAEHNARYLERVAAEMRYLLASEDPDGKLRQAGKVGLITYAGCEQQLAEALGIPYGDRTGHFWGIRGSNKLEQCEVLLVVGTPALPPETIARLAQCLYASDPEPLDETTQQTPEGYRYQDPRMQRLADAITHAELTQCAHRNRPLRHDGRTVITLCAGEIDYLPVTEEVTSLPSLTKAGRDLKTARREDAEGRLADACAELHAHGEAITVAALAREARVRKALAVEWVKARTHILCNLHAVPKMQIRKYLMQNGNRSAIAQGAPEAPAETASPPTPIGAVVTDRRPFLEQLEQMRALGIPDDDAIPLILARRGALSSKRGDLEQAS